MAYGLKYFICCFSCRLACFFLNDLAEMLQVFLKLLLASSVTALPLVLFANAANQLPLSMLGFIQYLSPTIALLSGVFLYHEPFTTAHAVSFGLIWLALLVYSRK